MNFMSILIVLIKNRNGLGKYRGGKGDYIHIKTEGKIMSFIPPLKKIEEKLPKDLF
jgi:hypothetical protein